MNTKPSVARLARLLSPCGDAQETPTPALLDQWIRQRHEAIEQAKASEDHRLFGHWLLRMAAITYRRIGASTAPEDQALAGRLQKLLERRPGRLEQHAQLHIDAASSIRRAQAVRERITTPGPVLLVGDDDATSLALALLGVEHLWVVDIDDRLLRFIKKAGSELGVEINVTQADVFEDRVPEPIAHRCAAAVTDPPRNAEETLQFALYGRAAMKRDQCARLFLCDHPDWDVELPHALGQLQAAGLAVLETIEELHAYPMALEVFPYRTEAAEALGLEPGWVEEMLELVQGWTHLYVLGRP